MSVMVISILAFAFAIRILPRILLPYALSDDTFSHLADAQMIRDNKYLIPKYYNKTVFKQIMGYPFGYMYLISLFRKKHEIIVEALTSPLFDVAQIFISYLFFKEVNSRVGVSFSNETSILFLLILSLLPTFLRNDTGPRAYQGSARIIGQFFYSLLLYSFYISTNNNDIKWFIVSVFSGSLIFVFSTFATQVFVFTGFIIGLFYSFKFLVVIMLSFLVFYLITLGKANQIVLGRYGHYDWYFKFYQKINLQGRKHFKNPLKDFVLSLKEWFYLLIKMNWKSVIIYFNISNNPFVHLIFSYFFYSSLLNYNNFKEQELYFLTIVCFACLVLFFLTMMKPLLFLGECYRYLEFGITPALILFFLLIHEKPIFLVFMYSWIIISVIRYVFYQIEFYKSNRMTHNDFIYYYSFFSKVNSIISGNVYASVEYRTKAAYFGNFNYLGNRGTIQLWNLSLENNYLAFGNYPSPGSNFSSLIERFNLKYWLTTKKELETYLQLTKEKGDFLGCLELIAFDEQIDTYLYRIKPMLVNKNQ